MKFNLVARRLVLKDVSVFPEPVVCQINPPAKEAV